MQLKGWVKSLCDLCADWILCVWRHLQAPGGNLKPTLETFAKNSGETSFSACRDLEASSMKSFPVWNPSSSPSHHHHHLINKALSKWRVKSKQKKTEQKITNKGLTSNCFSVFSFWLCNLNGLKHIYTVYIYKKKKFQPVTCFSVALSSHVHFQTCTVS